MCRHDVDFSPHRSLKIAQIENELGISAYYFVLLRSSFYNLLEREISQIFQEIIKLGHIIGLHTYQQIPLPLVLAVPPP